MFSIFLRIIVNKIKKKINQILKQFIIKTISLNRNITKYNIMNTFLYLVLILVLLGLILLVSSICYSLKEPFTNTYPPNYPSPSTTTRINHYNPMVSLPPGFSEKDYDKPNMNPGLIPQFSDNKFCNKNPMCYPCPNWKVKGGPMCSF